MNKFGSTFRKNLYACLLGPLSVIPASIIYALAFKVIEPAANASNFELVPLVVLIALMVSYPVTVLFGLPVILILQKLGKFNFINVLAVTEISVLLYGLLSGAQTTEIVLAIYFSCFVVAGCCYLYKVG